MPKNISKSNRRKLQSYINELQRLNSAARMIDDKLQELQHEIWGKECDYHFFDIDELINKIDYPPASSKLIERVHVDEFINEMNKAVFESKKQ